MRSRSWSSRLSIALPLLLLSGCGKPPSLTVTTKAIELAEPPRFHPPRPASLAIALPANPWTVLPKGQPAPDTLYAMTPEAYGALALALAAAAKWIGDANAVIDYYEAQR